MGKFKKKKEKKKFKKEDLFLPSMVSFLPSFLPCSDMDYSGVALIDHRSHRKMYEMMVLCL